MRHPRLRTALRVVLISLGSLLGLVVLVLFAAIMVARSDWGQRRILGIVLPIVNKSLLGRVEIGGLGGDLIHRLVVRDIKLYDSEKVLAASVGRAEVSYNLFALLHKDLHITSAKVTDGAAYLRFLRDGRLNFAGLTKPSPPSGPLPITITVDGAEADVDASFEPQAGTAVPAAGARLHLEASARIAQPRIDVAVKTVQVLARDPLAAEIEIHGGARIVTGAQLAIDARDVIVSVKAAGSQISRLAPAAALRGDWSLALKVGGSLERLEIDGALRPPAGILEFKGSAGVLDPRLPGTLLPWQIKLNGRGIDPAAARQGLPSALVNLLVEGHGNGPKGRVDLKSLAVTMTGASVFASGFAEGNATQPIGFPVPTGIAAQIAVKVDAPDLAAALAPFAPKSLKPAGSLRADLSAGAEGGVLRVDLSANGQKLRVLDSGIEQLTLALNTQDLTGKLKLHADTVQSPLKLDVLDLNAAADQKSLSVRAAGRDNKQLVFDLAVDGKPYLRGKELLGLDATLNRLMLARAGQRLDLDAPAHVSLDMQAPTGPIVGLDRLAVRLGGQQIAVGGRFEAKPQRFRASVDALGINARQWADLAGVKDVPQTRFTLHAKAAGTPQAPEGSVELFGIAAAMPALHLPPSELRVNASVRSMRAEGDVAVKLGDPAKPGERPYANLRFAAPLALTGPIEADLTAQTTAEAWKELLPPAVKGLRGVFGLRTMVRGTLQEPEVDLTLIVPTWQLDPLRGRGMNLSVKYAREKLGLGLNVQVDGRDAQLAAATVKADTRVRLGLIPGLNGAEIVRQLMHAPLTVDATVSHVNLPKVLAAVAPPVPVVVQTPVPGEDAPVPKLATTARPATGAATSSATGSKSAPASPVSSSPVRTGAGGPADPATNPKAAGAPGATVVSSTAAPGGDSPLKAGMLDATLHVEGTPVAPTVKLRADAKGLDLDIVRDLAAGVSVDYAGSALRADVTAGRGQEKLLNAHAETTISMDAILSGRLDPKQLPVKATVDVLPLELSQISKVRGSVTAHAEAKGTVSAPELTAWVRSQSVQIENFAVGPLEVKASLDKNRLAKADLDIKQSGGSIKASAKTLVPPKLESIELSLVSQNFRVDYSPPKNSNNRAAALGLARAVLNANLQVKGQAGGPKASGFLKLENGALVMKALQQPLNDIRVDLQLESDGKGKSSLTLNEARAAADTGKAKVSGRVQLSGTKLGSLKIDADASQFPVWAGVFGLWIDAKVRVSGHTEGDTLKIMVDMPEGGVRVPKLMSARTVQPLGPFEDVRLVDRAAIQAALRAAAKQAQKEREKSESKTPEIVPSHIRVSVQLPDGLNVSGPELRASLTGRVDLAIDGDKPPKITGQVHGTPSWGWIELLKRRYEIDRIEASLSGDSPPNPILNVQISRKLDEATIYVSVTGTARKPKISFRSEPPLYDESQIIAIIVTGDTGSTKKDPQAMGMLSSLLIGQLRDQLADRLPIDVIRVDTAGDDPMGLNQSSLEIGKYIRDDLYLGYKRRFGTATTGMRRLNADEVLLEYHFLKSYKIKTLYGDANVGAIDLYWTKHF